MSVEQKAFWNLYPLDATTYKYGKLGDLLDQARRGFVETVGSSVNVTATNTATGTIASVRAADRVWFVVSQALVARSVSSVTNAETFVVNTAIDLGTDGVPWFLRQSTIGAADTDGWHSAHMYPAGVSVLINVLNIGTVGGGIDVKIETKGGSDVTAPILIYENNVTVAGNLKIDLTVPVEYVRVGLKAGASAGTGSSVSVEMVGMIAN